MPDSIILTGRWTSDARLVFQRRERHARVRHGGARWSVERCRPEGPVSLREAVPEAFRSASVGLQAKVLCRLRVGRHWRALRQEVCHQNEFAALGLQAQVLRRH